MLQVLLEYEDWMLHLYNGKPKENP